MKAFAGLSSSDDDDSDVDMAPRDADAAPAPDAPDAPAADPEAAARLDRRFRAELKRPSIPFPTVDELTDEPEEDVEGRGDGRDEL